MFGILQLLAYSRDPLGISDISKALNDNIRTVFHGAYTPVNNVRIGCWFNLIDSFTRR